MQGLESLLGRSSGVLVQKRSQSADRFLEENRRNQQDQNSHPTATLPRYERGEPSLIAGYGGTPSETGYPQAGYPPPPNPPPNYSTLQPQAQNKGKKKGLFGRTSMPPVPPPPPPQQYPPPSQYPPWDPRWAKEQDDAMKRVQREQEKMLKLQQKEAQRQMKIQQVE